LRSTASARANEQRAIELKLNSSAQRLLDEVVSAEERLHRLLARPITTGRFSRRITVELVSGEVGVIRAHAAQSPHEGGALVAVLELERQHHRVSPTALSTLTTREREVAALVVDGLTDREIAERLSLSRHTISQYVKRVYRKLDVDSRIGLARLVLGHHHVARRD
jgi:RNA polymerase sigma factor (sigma-70 family)